MDRPLYTVWYVVSFGGGQKTVNDSGDGNQFRFVWLLPLDNRLNGG